MEIKALGYLGIGSSRAEEWRDLATKLLGMQQVDMGGGSMSFRMDDRKQRLVIDPNAPEPLSFIGWEVSSNEDLNSLADRLDRQGIKVVEGSSALADQRYVKRLIIFQDPEGNRLEAFCGPHVASDPFRPGRPITGFRTGALGMGHVVLDVADVNGMLEFYTRTLGFHVTDFGLAPYKLYFLHINNRHHSFALVGGGRRTIHHVMVEVCHLDDVGQGYDLAQIRDSVAYTLGRHTNDHVTSFYTHTPSGFFFEYGWGGRQVDPLHWTPHETHDGPSLWGHERLYLDASGRKRLRDMRLDAAARGVRAPIAPDCLWLNSIIGHE